MLLLIVKPFIEIIGNLQKETVLVVNGLGLSWRSKARTWGFGVVRGCRELNLGPFSMRAVLKQRLSQGQFCDIEASPRSL